MTILEKICIEKRQYVESRKQDISLSHIENLLKDADPARGFAKALQAKAAKQEIGLIAEIKKCGSVAVSLDCRGKMLATRGWTEESSFNIKKALEILDLQEPDAYIYTQIEKDGTLNGPDFDGLREVLGLTKGEVIASGGVSQLSDLKALDDLKVKNNSLSGIIVGRALYEGLFDVSEAIRCLSDRE